MTDLLFRPVTPEDRAGMLDICRDIWDGDDYLPSVFDDWLAEAAEPAGAAAQFTAAEQDGKLVGLARLTRLAPGEYWLEGIRIHPNDQGRGLGSALVRHLVERWQRLAEPGTLRLITSARNQAMIGLCQRAGFRRLMSCTFVEAPSSAAPHRFRPLAPAEAGQAFAVIRGLPAYAEMHGLCDFGWTWRSLTPELLAEHIAAGAAHAWGPADGLRGVVLTAADDEAPDVLSLRFLGVPDEARTAGLADARGLAHALGLQQVRFALLDRADILADAGQAGYARAWDGAGLCFELAR